MIDAQELDQEQSLVLMHYKEPLRRARGGYGYLGAIQILPDGTGIQCHICGKTFANLSMHIYGKHKMRVKDYKTKYQLAPETALVSESHRIKLKNSMIAWLKTLTPEEIQAWRAKQKLSGVKGARNRPKGQPKFTLESKNKQGTCPDQLLDRIRKVRKELGHTPSKKEFIKACGTTRYYRNILSTFGGYHNALKELKLTPKPAGVWNKYTDKEILDRLRQFHRTTRRVPTGSDARRGFIPRESTINSHFGSLVKARQLAGIKVGSLRGWAGKVNRKISTYNSL